MVQSDQTIFDDDDINQPTILRLLMLFRACFLFEKIVMMWRNGKVVLSVL